MPLFWKPYTSDVTAFLERLKAERADYLAAFPGLDEAIVKAVS